MKIIVVLSIVSLLFIANLSAQQAQPNLENWIQTYQLDVAQQKTAKQLIEQRVKNLAALETIKTSSPDVYQEKLLVLEKQTRMGLKSVLNDRQLVVFEAEEANRKAAIVARVAQLKASGAEKEEIAKATKALKY